MRWKVIVRLACWVSNVCVLRFGTFECFVQYYLIIEKNLHCPSVLILKMTLLLLNHNVLDEMGGRINELEQSVSDLRTEIGAEGSPSPLPPSKKADEVKPEEASA